MTINWSIVSIISRFLAQAIGIVQSFVIIRILTVGEYGLVGLVMSIAALVGVVQNLGISSASTREIAAAKDKHDAFKVYLGSLSVRFLITFPLVMILLISSSWLGNDYYKYHEVVWPIRILGIVLLIQVFQSVTTSAIQGLKKFGFLFTFQVSVALLSLVIFIPFIVNFQFIGYFYAFFVLNFIWTAILLIYLFYIFKEDINLPSISELKVIMKAVFSIGVYMYLIKIFFTLWQKGAPLILGKVVDEAILGVFTFALFVASKVITVSDAITDVTLPTMTGVFEKDKENFKSIFLKSNSKAFLLITFSAVALIIFKYPLLSIADWIFSFIGKSIIGRYEESFSLMDPMIIGFWAYGNINLLTSGIAVPYKKLKGALGSYLLLSGVAIFTYFMLPFDPVKNMTFAIGISAIVSYFVLVISFKSYLGYYPFTKEDLIYLILSTIFVCIYLIGANEVILFSLYSAVTVVLYVRFFSAKYNFINNKK